MQFRLIPALALFLGSYFPLALILLVQDIRSERWGAPVCTPSAFSHGLCTIDVLAHPWISISAVLITGAAIALALFVFNKVRLRFQLEVIEAKAVPNDLINYVFPYVVSFMGLDFSGASKVAGIVVFLALMFALTYRSGQIVMNPLLLVFGWRLYEAKIRIGKAERVVRALKKGRLVPGTQQLGEEVQEIYFMGDV